MPYSFQASLSGTAYASESHIKFCKGSDHRVWLEFDPRNEFDSNAIRVLGGAEKLFIGYVDRESAAKIHRLKSKKPQATAVFDNNGTCYLLDITLEVDPPEKKKKIQTGVILQGDVISGCIVSSKLPVDQLKKFSDILSVVYKKGKYIVSEASSETTLGVLDSKTAGIIDRSGVKIIEVRVFDFHDDHLFVTVRVDGVLLTDLDYQRKIIVSLFQKMPEYLGHHYDYNGPTEAQFNYALALGIDMREQTFESTSRAIDRAKAKGIKAHTPLPIAEMEELYRYLCRESNRRYAFLDELPNSTWKNPEQFKPVPAENMKEEKNASPKLQSPSVQACQEVTEVKISCPSCGKHYEYPVEMNNQSFICQKCGTEFLLHSDIPKYLRAICPHCKKQSIYPPDSLGKSFECPECHKCFTKYSRGANICAAGCFIIFAFIAFSIIRSVWHWLFS